MRTLAIPIIVLGYVLACESYLQQVADANGNQLQQSPDTAAEEKRRYNFGLGRRSNELSASDGAAEENHRFKFGLGRRSDEGPSDSSESLRYKIALAAAASPDCVECNRYKTLMAQQQHLHDSNDITSEEKRGYNSNYGMGRRAYTYTGGSAGIKRLPVYNFGLGKRARPYAFGLGKRADDEMDFSEFDIDEKRARPYSFGLGKRLAMLEDDDQTQKRGKEYNFGLGKR